MTYHTTALIANRHTFYLDITGQGGRVFDEVDRACIRKVLPAEANAHAARYERMVGVDMSRPHSISIRDQNGSWLTDSAFTYDVSDIVIRSQPASQNPNVINDYEDVTLRFELVSDKPFDFDTFDFSALFQDRHGGLFVDAVMFNGMLLTPIWFD